MVGAYAPAQELDPLMPSKCNRSSLKHLRLWQLDFRNTSDEKLKQWLET